MTTAAADVVRTLVAAVVAMVWPDALLAMPDLDHQIKIALLGFAAPVLN